MDSDDLFCSSFCFSMKGYFLDIMDSDDLFCSSFCFSMKGYFLDGEK